MGILSNFMNLNRYEILASCMSLLMAGWHGNAVMTPPKLPDG